MNYIGNYDYYLEKKEERTAALSASRFTDAKGTPKGAYFQAERPAAEPSAAETGAASANKQSWLEQKEAQARERKRKNELKRTEETISLLEARNQEINELMTHEDVYSNSVKCQELAEEKAANDARLEELYELWAELEE